MVLVVAYRAHRRTRVKQLEWWHALAKQHGLKVHSPGEPHETELEGAYRGVQVKVFMAGGHISQGLELYTHAVARLPGGAPPGFLAMTHTLLGRLKLEKKAPRIDIDGDLSGLFDLHGHDLDKTVETLGDARLAKLMVQAAQVADFVRIDQRAVTLEKKGVLDQQLPGFVDLAARLAAALSEAYERPWAAFAQRHGLLLRGAGSAAVQRVLRGHLKGQRVAIEMGLVPGTTDATFTSIRVGLKTRLPAGMRVAPKGGGGGRGTFDTGVGALDQVVDVQGTNREMVRALLQHPPLRDHLVAFYEVCPFTIIENNSVVAGGPGLLTGDMEAQVSAVMDLAAAIRKAWDRVQRSGAGKRSAGAGDTGRSRRASRG